MDATNPENHTTIIAIAPSPINKDLIWVGSDDGNLQLTTDGGNSWTNLNKNLKGLPQGSWIPQIHVSEYNPGEAFVVANNYRRNDYAAYAYFTSDYGKTWSRIADDSQIKGFVLSIVQDHIQPNGRGLKPPETLALTEGDCDSPVSNNGRGLKPV